MPADSLLNPSNKDKTPVWILTKHGRKCHVPMWVAKEHIKKYDAQIIPDEEGEFVPKKKVKPFDDGKKERAQKNANTELTGGQMQELSKLSHDELDAKAKDAGVEFKGKLNKKAKLEALEEAGVLY